MQNALTVVNGSGLDVRTAFNLAIQAINTDFAGATDPTTMSPSNAFAYMTWLDTTNNLIKQRNKDNNTWVTKGALLADGTIAWYASVIKITPTGGISATDVQTAIYGLDTGKVNTSDVSATAAANKILKLDANGNLPANASNGVPTGTIIMMPRQTPPVGYLKANGALLSRAAYPALWAEAQVSSVIVSEALWTSAYVAAYSTGDGSTTFRIPMVNGRFPRFYADGNGLDIGRDIGTAQTENTPRPASYNVGNISSTLNFANGAYVAGNLITSAALLPANAVENRPANIALMGFIKY